MSWRDVENFIENGGAGGEIINLVKRLREDGELRRRLTEEVILFSGASANSALVIDRHVLDDFLNGRLPMPLRVQVLSAVTRDDALWRQLEQIMEMQQAAEEFEEPPEDKTLPDEIKDEAVRYDASDETVRVISLSRVHDRWRIEEQHPGYNYDIRPRTAARLGEEASGIRIADEATISHCDIRCAVTLSAQAKKLELHIENCPLGKDRFAEVEVRLRSEQKTLHPSGRLHSRGLCRIVFDNVEPHLSYVLEFDPALLKG